MRKQKGFSLIYLLIVVAIILIIAAIAIPNLLRARMAANEAVAAARFGRSITPRSHISPRIPQWDMRIPSQLWDLRPRRVALRAGQSLRTLA